MRPSFRLSLVGLNIFPFVFHFPTEAALNNSIPCAQKRPSEMQYLHVLILHKQSLMHYSPSRFRHTLSGCKPPSTQALLIVYKYLYQTDLPDPIEQYAAECSHRQMYAPSFATVVVLQKMKIASSKPLSSDCHWLVLLYTVFYIYNFSPSIEVLL